MLANAVSSCNGRRPMSVGVVSHRGACFRTARRAGSGLPMGLARAAQGVGWRAISTRRFSAAKGSPLTLGALEPRPSTCSMAGSAPSFTR